MVLKIIFIVLGSANLYSQEAEEPLDIQLGEKLFLEDRFSQSFFRDHNNQVNKVINSGDPILDFFETPMGSIANPQKGRRVSCSSCHFVDQVTEIKENFVFTYNDFSIVSKVPERNDFITRTTRNSMNMVLSATKENRPLHWDGEFYSAADLSCASLVGRNMGWQNSEASLAREHIVKTLRGDEGVYPTDSDLKESYESSFLTLGYDFKKMKEQDVLKAVCEMMARYIESLDFSRDEVGDFNGSAYDQFLIKNDIRTGANQNESERDYLQYLRNQIIYKQNWFWIDNKKLDFHDHDLKFGKNELKGMKIFFGKAQCASCHVPPNFTNFGFHATGVTQLEYDKTHGLNQFKMIKIPQVKERLKQKERYFIASEENPGWQGLFKNSASKEHPEWIDLGVWNILGHPDKIKVQDQIKRTICKSQRRELCEWDDETYLNFAVASFKTPTLRSLGQSKPYFHNGQAATLIDVFKIYQEASRHAKKENLINGDPMLKVMNLEQSDFHDLKLFLEALDEDYN